MRLRIKISLLILSVACITMTGCNKPEEEVRILRYHSGKLGPGDSSVKIALPQFRPFATELAFVKLMFYPPADSSMITVTGKCRTGWSGNDSIIGCYSVFDYTVDLSRISDTVVFKCNKRDRYSTYRYVLSY
ncbi:MAG: hypothetical protein NTW10_12800 [Bacteroidetes bacterium]|nr:hypothetical protein [Bacteroidota bacterium]